MVAVDTNVVVRFLTHDHPRQAARAEALFRTEEIWLAKTVLLETEWVLRSLYSFSGQRVNVALRALAGLPNVRVEDPAGVTNALEWWRRGLDFADALHLAGRPDGARFVSFDTKFVKRALQTGMGGVELL